MEDPRWIKKPYIIPGYIERMFRNNNGFKYEGIVHNQLIVNGEISENSNCAINNFKFREKATIKEKTKQNKRLLDRKIANQGWTFMNCVHYADVYRGLWMWFGEIKNGERAIHYLDMALKIKDDPRMAGVRKLLLQGVQNAKSKY